MTHSNHRQGTYADLSHDFVVLGSLGREFDDPERALKRFKEIGFRHEPINVPGIKSWHSLVYDDKEKVGHLLSDLAAANLGLSVTVSGLLDQVRECCGASDMAPHTVNQSLGFWGRPERLPHFNILKITTMCGHGRISPNLVWHLAGQVQHTALDIQGAARKMGKLCLCNIFNELRAARLLGKLVSDLQAGLISVPPSPGQRDVAPKQDFGIVIDQAECTGCMECLPYCPVTAIVERNAGSTIAIDPERCTECGVCLSPQVCPVGAIVAKELTWPRTLRGKFHNMHSPYRATPTLAKVSRPLSYTGEGRIVVGYQFPSELTNDVTGFIKPGELGIVAELGRPHLGTTFRDVEKVTQALVPLGLKFDALNPLTDLATDVSTGSLRRDILDETTGWVLLRLIIPEERAPQVLQSLRRVSAEIDTVFAVNIISTVKREGSIPGAKVAMEVGVTPAVNGKTNVGLGRQRKCVGHAGRGYG